MLDSPVEPAIRGLKWLLKYGGLTPYFKCIIKTLVLEFRFLETFLSRCRVHNCSSNANLKDLLKRIETMSQDAELVFTSDDETIESSCIFASQLLETIQSLKPEISEAHVLITRSSAHVLIARSLSVSEATELSDYIRTFHDNLKDLVWNGGNSITIFEKQIEALEKDMSFQREFLEFFTNRCSDDEKVSHLWCHFAEAVDEAVRLSFLAWCHTVDDDIAMEVKIGFSDLQEKFKPTRPKAWEIYVDMLKASTARYSYRKNDFVTIFLDSLLEKLSRVLSCKADWVVLMADELIVFHKDLKQVQFLLKYIPKRCLEIDKVNYIITELEAITFL